MNKKLASLMVILFLSPLGLISAQNTTNETSSTQAPNSINGAFGIVLGEHFTAPMVKKVLEKQQQTYLGKNKTKLTGTLFQVESNKPDKHFQDYSIKTTKDGIIFAIQAEYQYEVEMAKGKKAGQVKKQKTVRSTCKDAVKKLATKLEKSYGKPRGKGWNGEWYSFRQISDNSDKKISLYANQCRTGLYRIIYTDEKARQNSISK